MQIPRLCLSFVHFNNSLLSLLCAAVGTEFARVLCAAIRALPCGGRCRCLRLCGLLGNRLLRLRFSQFIISFSAFFGQSEVAIDYTDQFHTVFSRPNISALLDDHICNGLRGFAQARNHPVIPTAETKLHIIVGQNARLFFY